MTILSEKREKFCLLLVSGKTLIEAYRQSRPAGMMDSNTASCRARDLLRCPEVLARIAELRRPAERAARRKYQYTLEAALAECDEAMALAMSLAQPSVMVSAILVKAKLSGLVVEKKEERYGLLDGITTKELLMMREKVRAELGSARPVRLLIDHSVGKKAEFAEGGMGTTCDGRGAPSTLDRD